MKSTFLVLVFCALIGVMVGSVAAGFTTGFPVQNPATCNPGAVTGTLCAGCPKVGSGDTIGTYSFQVIPTYGGVYLKLSTVQIFTNCTRSNVTSFAINIQTPFNSPVVTSGQYTVNDMKTNAITIPPGFTKGWGYSGIKYPVESNLMWYFPNATTCSTFGVELHFTGTDCAGASQTIIGGGTSAQGTIFGASPFPGNRWGWSLNVTDCTSCQTTPQCATAPTNCNPNTGPCPFTANNVTCQAIANAVSCRSGYCQPDFTCKLIDDPACAKPGVVPLVKCASCVGSTCYAQFGYDTRSVDLTSETVAAGNVIRQITSTNNKITSTASPGNNWGQPTAFFVNSYVPAAFIVAYPSTATLSWTLDGVTVSVGAGVTNVVPCSSCDFVSQITASAQNSSGTTTFSYVVSSPPSTCAVPTNFLFDVPTSCTPSVSVTPSSCVDSSRSAGFLIDSDSFDAQLNSTDRTCVLSQVNLPYSVPISSSCSSYTVFASFPNSCGVSVGSTRVATAFNTACANCGACRVSKLLGPNTPCTVQTCTISGYVWNSATCSCTPCTTQCNTQTQRLVQSPGSCSCQPCTPPTCAAGQYILYPCDTCRNCPTPSCPAGKTPQSVNEVPLGQCPGCKDCVLSCATNSSVDSATCTCKPCPNNCGANQVAIGGNLCNGCTNCPTPSCTKNQTVTTANPCICTPCTDPQCNPDVQSYVDPTDVCKGCKPCDPSAVTCAPGSSKSDPSRPCKCIPCTAPTCSSPFKNPTDPCGTCVPCTPPTCTSPKKAPTDPCGDCVDCVPPTCSSPNKAPTDPCGTCVPCTPPTCTSPKKAPTDPCGDCVDCVPPTCPAGFKVPADPCGECEPCTDTVCDPDQYVDPSNSCNCLPCTAGTCTCVNEGCPPGKYPDLSDPTTDPCPCLDCTPPTCSSPFKDPSDPCGTCVPCTPPTCTSPKKAPTDPCGDCVDCVPPTCSSPYKAPTDPCGDCVPCTPPTCTSPKKAPEDPCGDCVDCVPPTCPAGFQPPADPCGECEPCTGTVCGDGEYVDPSDACNCLTCPTLNCPDGMTVDASTLPCPTCVDCRKTATDCGNNSSPVLCACEPCSVPDCGANTYYDADDLCSGCKPCPPLTCPPGEQRVDPIDDCAGCTPCPAISCPHGQERVDANNNCLGCTPCTIPTCGYGEHLDSTGCNCAPCTAPTCSSGSTLDSTGCSCVSCVVTSCPDGQTVNVSDPCSCVTVPVTPPPNSTEPKCPTSFDACGVCGGKNRTCIDCSGCLDCNKTRYVDSCGVVCGDGSTCPGCKGDLCNVCTKPIDLCGVCGGDSTTCYGCDGVPASGTIYDWCGVCGGNGTSCLGCDGKPNTSGCSPAPLPPGAVAAVSSLVALAALGSLGLAAILWRMRKRPEVLFQAWDEEIENYLTEIQNNPLAHGEDTTQFSPIFHMDHPAGH